MSAAVLAQRSAPLTARFAGGVLVARTRLRRWMVRAAVAVTVSIVVVMVAFAAFVALVLSAL